MKKKFLFLPFTFLFFTFLSHAQTLAPGKDAHWASAGKQAVGTSASLESKAWFTLAQGVLTEVYYPDVTAANVHLLQFVVVNPKTKKVETERDDTIQKLINENEYYGGTPLTEFQIAQLRQAGIIPNVKKVKPEDKLIPENSLQFIQQNTAKSGKWKIKKRYITDVENNTILIRVFFETTDKNLELYVYYDPSLGNTGMHDTAWSQGEVLLAQDKDKCSALLVGDGRNSERINDVSSGFYQVSDGLEQLRQDGKLSMPYSKAENGNVVQMAKIVSTDKKSAIFTLSLGFGNSPQTAFVSASNSLKKGFDNSYIQFVRGWNDYVKTLPKVDKKYQAQFNMAAMVLKASEDKTVRGANVASLTIPWGGGANANEDVGGGYHLVWSRDLYQVVTAYMALGDTAAANRALDFLFNVQQKPDGSFPQNSWLDGRPSWNSLQLDEVAYPLILAYQLGKNDKETYQNHVRRAADFLVKTGPKTTQERWEEKSGYSPSTIAAEIAGLVCAADIAKKNGDSGSASVYLATADDWARNVERWTATTKGKYGDGNYYLRLTENGTPDAGEKTVLNNGAGTFLESEIVDAGFLELVRLGIKSPDDALIQKSVKVIDQVLKVNTPNGEAFYRYNHDGYGEMDDGRRWNWDGKYTGKGRLWALLSGERGQYEIALANSRFQIPNSKNSKSNLKSGIWNLELSKAKSRLDAILGFAGDGLMIPEQVWDSTETPKNIDKQYVPELKFGEGTGSATPLAWSMAQFIRLAVNLQAGRNLDTPDVVYNRYKNGIPAKNDFGSVRVYQQVLNDTRVEINVDFSTAPENRVFVLQRDKSFEVTKNASGKLSFSSVIAKSQATVPKENEKIWYVIENPKGEMELGTTELKPEYENYENETPPKEIAEKLSKATQSPVIIGDKAYFIYRHASYSEIMGDFNGWQPERHNWSNLLDSGDAERHTKFYAIKFAPTARVEYKIQVRGEWVVDPLNPNRVDNGVGGENSFFTMPEYKPTEWDKNRVANVDGYGKVPTVPNYDTLEIDSKIYGKRIVKVYEPTNEKSRLPTVYLQDGTDYINRAKAIQTQYNLVNAGKIKPFIMVFIDPKDRMKEYWVSDDYAKFLATEVVPAIDAKYNTIKNRDGRAILGASLGGVTSIHAAIKYPEIFGRVGGQSSSFWIDNERVVKELETLDAAKNQFKFYLDTGTLEGAENSRRVNLMLRGRGFPVTYQEGETGHNWTAWRDRLADAFLALWK